MDDEVLTVDRADCALADAPGDSISQEVAFVCQSPGAVLMDDRGTSPAHDHEPAPQADVGQAVRPNAADQTAPTTVDRIIEALLFSADTPLSALRLAELAGDCTTGQVRRHIDALNDKYATAGLSFRIEPIAHGYRMMTLSCYQPWLARLNQQRSQTRLSAAALETVSIVAYKQPVIRADVEAIRGVACGDVLSRLREMGLIRIIGRAEVVGRPLLYGTTKKFLDVFGLADLEDLPPMEALMLRRQTTRAEEQPAEPPTETPLVASA